MHACVEGVYLIEGFFVGAVLTGPRAHVAWFVHRGRLSGVKGCLSAGLERKYIVPAVLLILLPLITRDNHPTYLSNLLT